MLLFVTGLVRTMSTPQFTATGHSFDKTLHWIITIPRFRLIASSKRKRGFSLLFQVTSNTLKKLVVFLRVESLSPLLQFHLKTVRTIGQDRINEESTALRQVKKATISSHQTRDFRFSLVYLPQLSVKSVSQIGLEYSLAAFEENGKIVIHTDPYQVLLPLRQTC